MAVTVILQVYQGNQGNIHFNEISKCCLYNIKLHILMIKYEIVSRKPKMK